MLASAFDFTAVFLAIHFLGAEHIRELEDAARKAVGLGKRDLVEGEEPALPSSADGENNADAAAQAAKVLKESTQAAPPAASKSSKSGGQSALWAEAVLAYTIHKTLLLPFRVGITAAVTPSFVKWLIRMGWAKPNTAVKRAAEKAAAAKASAKAAN